MIRRHREVHSLITGTGLQFAEAGVEASGFLGVLRALSLRRSEAHLCARRASST